MDIAISSVSTSDDSGIDISVGPTTPDDSPLFGASRSIETRFTSLSDLISLEETSLSQTRRRNIPDILDPATAIGIPIKNVCFIGAGYVGE